MVTVQRYLNRIFVVFPPFSLGSGLLQLISNEIKTELFEDFGVDAYESPIRWQMIGTNLAVMAFETLFFLAVKIAMEYNLFGRFKRL